MAGTAWRRTPAGVRAATFGTHHSAAAIGGGQAGLSMSYCLTERASITSYWTASGPARTGANAAYATSFAPAAHPGA